MRQGMRQEKAFEKLFSVTGMRRGEPDDEQPNALSNGMSYAPGMRRQQQISLVQTEEIEYYKKDESTETERKKWI